MKKLLLLFCFGWMACHSPEKTFVSEYLSTSNLSQQSFSIDPEKDTLLTSYGGVRIKIAKGTFAAGQAVTIEWKEALDFGAILNAGLTTQSGKELLQSGGMFYFNTKEKLPIQNPIEIAVPTETAASGMQLYKGDSSSGKMDWKEPKPIKNPRQLNGIGQKLFLNNCATCHRSDRDSDPPFNLLGINERRSRQWLYAVTRNPAMMLSFDPVLCCQKNKYGVVMQAFPGLSNAAIDSIYDYIDYETEKSPTVGQGLGCDACTITDPAYDSLLASYNKTYDTRLRSNTLAYVTTPNSLIAADGTTYYQVAIEAPGWYNVDALLKEWTRATPSNLIVYPQGESREAMSYYLAIPDLKILVTGTVQNKGETVVFDEASGQIPLPQQRKAFILAAGTKNGNYFFVMKDFVTTGSQTIDLPLQQMPKQQFDRQMEKLKSLLLHTKAPDNAPAVTSTIATVSDTISGFQTKLDKDSLVLLRVQLQKLAIAQRKDCGCGIKQDGTATENK